MADLLETDLCVIGGGSGGLSVAAGAAQLGARVVLIEKGRMGGDCLNYGRSEEHTSELPSLMRNSYAVFCLQKKISSQENTSEINAIIRRYYHVQLQRTK